MQREKHRHLKYPPLSNLLDFVCLETTCANYLVDWQLSYPERAITLWDGIITLRPYYSNLNKLDGTIGDHSFEKRLVLGSGGFSKVYLGTDWGNVVRKKDDGRILAMKVISKRLASHWKGELVKREFDLWVQVSEHPYVVKMLYAYSTESSYNFVMELCPGGTLLQLLRVKKCLPNRLALIYFLELLLVFEHLHENNIIYRDLKVEIYLL